MYSVVPATRSLLSRFPAMIQGGALLKRPALSGGASPMLPKKGCSGMSIPGAKCATMCWASSGIILILVGIIVRQVAAAGAEGVVGVRNGEFYGEDFYFEDVADLRAFNVNRPSENVSAGAFVFDLVGNVAQGLLDLVRWYARVFEALGAVGDERLDLHGVAGLDAQDGGGFGVVVAPGYRFGRGF